MRLWYKHNGKRWFRWRIGKLTITYGGNTSTLGIKYWGEILWDGVCIVRWGRYI